MDDLTEHMRHINLGEQLLFHPQDKKILGNIPPYLFRVVSPLSDGKTEGGWARSKSAYQERSSPLEDIFSNLDHEKQRTIARRLNLHLRWWTEHGVEDNFVSWTSSLLFAIQYIYYRHLSSKDGSNLEDIHLYVIDTSLFPKGTFLRDLDLIDAFRKFDNHPEEKNLENLWSLRKKPDFYFGEYLSQGSLKIEGKSQTIPATVLFDKDRLRRIQPEFTELGDASKHTNPSWVNEVRRLRKIIWPVFEARKLQTKEVDCRLQAVREILPSFEPAWRFPIAIYLTALIGSESVTDDLETAHDNIFFAYFRSKDFEDSRERFQLLKSNIVAPDTMPELKRVEKLVREISKESLLREALDLLAVSEANIRLLKTPTVFPDHPKAFVVTDPNEALARAGQTILARLRTIQMLCENVSQAIS